MNAQIMKILPAKKEFGSICAWLPSGRESDAYLDGYNTAIKNCYAALAKSNLVVCPTNKKMAKLLRDLDHKIELITYPEYAKALLALLQGER